MNYDALDEDEVFIVKVQRPLFGDGVGEKVLIYNEDCSILQFFPLDDALVGYFREYPYSHKLYFEAALDDKRNLHLICPLHEWEDW